MGLRDKIVIPVRPSYNKPQVIDVKPNCPPGPPPLNLVRWSHVVYKPFESVDTESFDVENDVLKLSSNLIEEIDNKLDYDDLEEIIWDCGSSEMEK